jgi:hypothetical protein
MTTDRRFPPPWIVDRSHPDSFVVKDANGITLATVHCRDDLQKWSFGHSKLTSDEARKIAKAISRIPEFMMQRKGFHSRGPGNYRWKAAWPYHVALEDTYIRANYDTISELCKLNGIPFNATDGAAREWLAVKGGIRLWRAAAEAGDPAVRDPLAEMILAGDILAGDIVDGDRVAISTEGNVLTFNGKAPQTAEIA